jgi:hypothetical protein
MRYYQKQQNTPATNPTHLLNLHQMMMDPLQLQCTNGFPTSSIPTTTITVTMTVTITITHRLLHRILSLHVSLFLENPAFKRNLRVHLIHRESKSLTTIPEELSRLLHHRRRIPTGEYHLRRWSLYLCLRRGTSWNLLTGELYLLLHARGRR